MRKFGIVFCLMMANIAVTNAYIFGLKSADNTIENIQAIESGYNLNMPIVGFIFDTRGPDSQALVSSLSQTLGTGKIYHLTLSPGWYTAKQIASGAYDEQYRSFFQTIKKSDIKVIFRTMHEMNGWRYSWSSIPKDFKKAWIHVWNIARSEGLDQRKILFDFSFNHVDMPTKEVNQSHESVLIECKPADKFIKKCPTFEDYYPGDQYVDILWVTFYNRGKGNSDRLWLTPSQILNNTWWDTLERMKQFNKPLFIDEVATTSVNYTGAYNAQKSQYVYENISRWKNVWLTQLKKILNAEPRLLWALYFNRDYTRGLKNWIVGELDWSVIDIENKRIYESVLDIFQSSKKSTALFSLFQTGNVFNYVQTVQKNTTTWEVKIPTKKSVSSSTVIVPLRINKSLKLKLGF